MQSSLQQHVEVADFRKASQRVYRTPQASSRIVVRVLGERTIP